MIKIYMGPMFSNKTTSLINLGNSLIKTSKTIFIKYSGDNRYNGIRSHGGLIYNNPYIITENLISIHERLLEYDNILIDEGQFFKDLVEITLSLKRNRRNIYIGYLNLTYLHNPFPNVSILCNCDQIEVLRSICEKCSNIAEYTGIKKKDLISPVHKSEPLIGGSELYFPICICCHFNLISTNSSKNN